MASVNHYSDVIADAIERYDCIETNPFTTAAGLPANRKINLDHIPENSHEFSEIIGGLVLELDEYDVDLVTAVPDGANRFGKAVAFELGLLFAPYHKDINGEFQPDNWADDEVLQETFATAQRIGIVEDVASTWHSSLQMADIVGWNRTAVIAAVVDRGQAVPLRRGAGILTAEDARAYAEKNPHVPPPHIATQLSRRALHKFPLPMMVSSEREEQRTQ